MHNFIIIGCGAIGTSIAKAIKSCITQSVVYGFDINSDLLKILKNKKIIDHILDKNHLPQLKLKPFIIICLPIDRFADSFSIVNSFQSVAVIDVCSLKLPILNLIQKKIANFVPCHPIAGPVPFSVKTDNFELGKMIEEIPINIFFNQKVIVCPIRYQSLSVKSFVLSFWEKLGSNVFQMTADRHDKIFEVTSHLPHILSVCIVAGMDKTLIKSNPMIKENFGQSTIEVNSQIWMSIIFENIYILKYMAKVISLINKTPVQQKNIITLLQDILLLIADKYSEYKAASFLRFVNPISQGSDINNMKIIEIINTFYVEIQKGRVDQVMRIVDKAYRNLF